MALLDERKHARQPYRMPTRLLPACFLALSLTGCGEPLFLMFEEHLHTPDGVTPVGSGCESIGEGSSGSVAGAAGSGGVTFSVEHEGHEDEGVRVIIRDGAGQVRAVRNYGEHFLRSGDVDEFEVELDALHTLQLRYWGGRTCEPPRPAE